ncbi:hypothetical protein [uncultured Mediterranean phage]|nr:hypothetical protein [uncultured Mediterranean phage]
MDALDGLTWELMIKVVVLSALASSSVTQVAKALLKEQVLRHTGMHRALLRGLSVLVGGTFGWWLAGAPLGATMGVASGGLTTTVVAAVKQRIKGEAAAEDL